MSLAQLYYEDLTFFPEPDVCEIEQGLRNEEIGLVAVHIHCAELVDIRDNGTITVDGYAAFPADMVVDLDIPETGGILMVGDEEWGLSEAELLVGAIFGIEEPGINLDTGDGPSIWIHYLPETDTLSLATIITNDEVAGVSSDQCTITSDRLVAVRPQTTYNEMTIQCDAIGVPGLGTVSIGGTVVSPEASHERSGRRPMTPSPSCLGIAESGLRRSQSIVTAVTLAPNRSPLSF